MQKRQILILLICALLVLCAVVLFTLDFGRQPFKDLIAEDLISAHIHVIAGTRDFESEVEDFQPLVEFLREIRIYRETEQWQNLSGGNTILELTYRDGRKTTLFVMHRMFVIDGAGYAAKYKPCAALIEYADKMVRLK